MSQQLKAHFPIFALVPVQIQLSWKHLSFSATCHPQAASGPYLFQLSDLRCQCLYIIASALSVIPPWKWRPGAQSSFLHCAAHFAFQSTFILTISLDCVRQLRASMPSYSQGLAWSVTYPGDGRASYSVLTASSISAHASVFTPFACIHSCKVGWLLLFQSCNMLTSLTSVKSSQHDRFFLSKLFLSLKKVEDLKTCFKLSPKMSDLPAS